MSEALGRPSTTTKDGMRSTRDVLRTELANEIEKAKGVRDRLTDVRGRLFGYQPPKPQAESAKECPVPDTVVAICSAGIGEIRMVQNENMDILSDILEKL